MVWPGSTVTRAALGAMALVAAPLVVAGPALASSGCDALNQASADGFYFKGRIAISLLQAGDVVTITAGLPVSPTPTNFVPSGFYLGIGVFDAGPVVPVVKFPGTLVYTVPNDVQDAHMNWATTVSNPDGIQVAATWQVSCQNAPKSDPTLVTQASPSVLLGGPVHDTATLSGGTSPTGTVTFRLYGPDDTTCARSAASTTSVSVAGNGSYASPPFTPAVTGTYRWTAVYSGDSRNNSATSACNAANQAVVVRPFQAPPPTATLTGDVAGPLTVRSGQSVVVTDGRMVGPVTVEPGGALRLLNTRVSNGIAADNPSFLSVCNSYVAGLGLVVTGAGVPLRIGDPANACAGNQVAGEIRLAGNTGGLTLGANTVSGNLTVDNNTVGTVVVKANVSRALACAGNNPAPVNSGQANAAATKSGQCSTL